MSSGMRGTFYIMEDNIQIPEKKPSRPQLLSILCVLTFIGSGLSAFSYLVFGVYYTDMIRIMELYYAGAEEFNFLLNAPRDFFVYSFILSAVSLLGAMFMWHLRKIGFHIYTVAQLISLVLPSLYFAGDANPLLNIMLTALFVYLYARNLQYMK
jgi:hypothetical protein